MNSFHRWAQNLLGAEKLSAGEETGLLHSCLTEVLADGFPVDSVVTCKDDFRDAIAGGVDEFGRPLRCERLLPALVDAALLGQGNAFALAFPAQGPLEVGEGTHDGSIRFAMGESSPVKTGCSLRNSNCTPRYVSPWTSARRSSRFRARRSMLCTTTVSPSRTNRSSSFSCGRAVSLPEAL